MLRNNKITCYIQTKQCILGVLVALFFFMYAFLYWQFPYKLNSPDETSNLFFISQFASTGSLVAPDSIYALGDGQLLPRSMKYVDGALLPGGFLGLPILFGLFARVVGSANSVFMTPFLAMLAVLCYFCIIRRLFSERIAFLSAVVLLLLPPFWYYAARGLLPNVLFVSLLIFSVWFWIRATEMTRWKGLIYFLSGSAFMGAVAVRPVELFWLVPFVGLVAWWYRRRSTRRMIISVALAVAGVVGILFLLNWWVYGSPFLTGYTVSGAATTQSQGRSFLQLLKYVMPFSINAKNIWFAFSGYYIRLFWWLSLPLAMGIVLALKQGTSLRQRRYFIVFVLSTVLLVLYYGSWVIQDNIRVGAVSIGNSYVRYWLPSFVLGVPYIAIFIETVYQRASSAYARTFVLVLLSAGALLSVSSVFFAEEGLLSVRTAMQSYAQISSRVQSLTENTSVILTQRSDKIFFPERRVIEYKDSFSFVPLLPRFVAHVPVYWYTMLTAEDIAYVQTTYFSPHGLALRLLTPLENAHALYAITYE